MSKAKFAKEVIVYICDWCDKEPILAVAESMDDIPCDIGDGKGAIVGVYSLTRTARFTVERKIEEKQ